MNLLTNHPNITLNIFFNIIAMHGLCGIKNLGAQEGLVLFLSGINRLLLLRFELNFAYPCILVGHDTSKFHLTGSTKCYQ